MQNFAIKKGSDILYHQKSASIVAAEQQCIVISVNAALETLTPAEYYEKIEQGLITRPPSEMVVAQCVTRLTYEERELAEKYCDYIRPLETEAEPYATEAVRRIIFEVAQKRGDTGKNVPKLGTLKGWYRKYTSDDIGRNVIKMVKSTATPRASQFYEAMMDLFFEVIDKEYLHLNGSSATETYLKFRNQAAKYLRVIPKKHRKKEKVIKRSTFFDYISKLDPVEVVREREGWAAAETKYRYSKEHIVATRPLEHVQIDAVHINLGLTDGDGNYVGMPVVYFAIDVFTRTILGYVISYAEVRTEEGIAAVELIKRIIRPKKKPEHCVNGYPLYGKPESLRHDSGVFSGKLCEDYLAHMQIHDMTSEVSKPWRNAMVERFNRTFREQCCKKIIGYVGKRTAEYKDTSTVKALAVCKVDEFVLITEKFILDVYHQNPHAGIDGMSPAQMANKYKALVEIPSIEYLSKLNSFIGREFTPSIQAVKGIQKNSVFYINAKLAKLRNKIDPSTKKTVKITAYYNELDISKISVLDPFTGEQFTVDCTSIKEPISLAEYKALKGASKKRLSATSRKTIETSTTIIGDIQQRYDEKEAEKARNKKSHEEPEIARFIPPEELDEIVGQGKPTSSQEDTSHLSVESPSSTSSFPSAIKRTRLKSIKRLNT
ncbi:hypothetical protein RGQ13_18145 [Thalassotalea psychrophila]|uniref:Integrase catalytic domain-containing protein n=1 Tax=Thalassotalea psychrophila TaxID=3065647 RepID=A0ABY9TTL4_9GAMM|nr:hypothetical protein RGQ13_18145 [Colwelliaceae bacterium SQ149]